MVEMDKCVRDQRKSRSKSKMKGEMKIRRKMEDARWKMQRESRKSRSVGEWSVWTIGSRAQSQS